MGEHEDKRAVDDRVVSFDSERLILVDEADREIGHASKADAHAGKGILHRAFSLFVFNPAGELLLQQRAASKPLWPGYWANSCCSHPRGGEDMDTATQRRLREELGFTCPLQYLYKFQYHAEYGDAGSETELCWVYVGTSDAPVRVNDTEIAAWRYVKPDALDREIAESPGHFTPWLKMEWQRLRGEFADRLPGSDVPPRRQCEA
ncbi:MAG TPA: isopentenyl-diphosphate Delta-isomerase [Rhodanobacteraceae bacterium]|nr:isopentenyl-diphosphate Delta-isomerase [Rhodanobacteraceae bacterium]